MLAEKFLKQIRKNFSQLLIYVNGIVGMVGLWVQNSKEFTQLLIYVNGIVGIIGLWVTSVVRAFGPWRYEV